MSAAYSKLSSWLFQPLSDAYEEFASATSRRRTPPPPPKATSRGAGRNSRAVLRHRLDEILVELVRQRRYVQLGQVRRRAPQARRKGRMDRVEDGDGGFQSRLRRPWLRMFARIATPAAMMSTTAVGAQAANVTQRCGGALVRRCSWRRSSSRRPAGAHEGVGIASRCEVDRRTRSTRLGSRATTAREDGTMLAAVSRRRLLAAALQAPPRLHQARCMAAGRVIVGDAKAPRAGASARPSGAGAQLPAVISQHPPSALSRPAPLLRADGARRGGFRSCSRGRTRRRCASASRRAGATGSRTR